VKDIVIPDIDSSDKEGFDVEPIYQPSDEDESTISDRVMISFKSFMDLVASHSYNKVIDDLGDSKVTVESELLTALANAHETKSEKRVPLIFSIGLIAGVIIAYLIIYN